MAEIIMKNKLKNAGVSKVRVTSAGVSAIDGGKMSANSSSALKELGYKPYGFKSKPVSEKLIRTADLVICMTAQHKLFFKGFKNVTTMNELAGLGDVPDPYGQGVDVYLNTAYFISAACEIILTRLINEKGDILK
jgi:protein-tyrosine-phosphatase